MLRVAGSPGSYACEKLTEIGESPGRLLFVLGPQAWVPDVVCVGGAFEGIVSFGSADDSIPVRCIPGFDGSCLMVVAAAASARAQSCPR